MRTPTGASVYIGRIMSGCTLGNVTSTPVSYTHLNFLHVGSCHTGYFSVLYDPVSYPHLSGTVTVAGVVFAILLYISVPPRAKRLSPSRMASMIMTILIFFFCFTPTPSFRYFLLLQLRLGLLHIVFHYGKDQPEARTPAILLSTLGFSICFIASPSRVYVYKRQ